MSQKAYEWPPQTRSGVKSGPAQTHAQFLTSELLGHRGTGDTGSVLAHAIYNSPKTDGDAPNAMNGLFTAFGDTSEEVEALLDVIRESDRAGSPKTTLLEHLRTAVSRLLDL